jgi:hypothetical protein
MQHARWPIGASCCGCAHAAAVGAPAGHTTGHSAAMCAHQSFLLWRRTCSSCRRTSRTQWGSTQGCAHGTSGCLCALAAAAGATAGGRGAHCSTVCPLVFLFSTPAAATGRAPAGHCGAWRSSVHPLVLPVVQAACSSCNRACSCRARSTWGVPIGTSCCACLLACSSCTRISRVALGAQHLGCAHGASWRAAAVRACSGCRRNGRMFEREQPGVCLW